MQGDCPVCGIKFDIAKRGTVCPNGHPHPDSPRYSEPGTEVDIATQRCDGCGKLAVGQKVPACEDGQFQPADVKELRDSSLIAVITGDSVGSIDLEQQLDAVVSANIPPLAELIQLRAAALHRPYDLIEFRNHVDELVDTVNAADEILCEDCGEMIELDIQFCMTCGNDVEDQSTNSGFDEAVLILGYLSGEDPSCVDRLGGLLDRTAPSGALRRAFHISALLAPHRTADFVPEIANAVSEQPDLAEAWTPLLVLLATTDETARRVVTELAFELYFTGQSGSLVSVLGMAQRDPELAASKAQSEVERVAAGLDRREWLDQGIVTSEVMVHPTELPVIFAEDQPPNLLDDSVDWDTIGSKYPLLVGALLPDILDATSGDEDLPETVVCALATIGDIEPIAVEPAIDALVGRVEKAEMELDARAAASALASAASVDFERVEPALYDYLKLAIREHPTRLPNEKHPSAEIVGKILETVVRERANRATAEELAARGYFDQEVGGTVIEDSIIT